MICFPTPKLMAGLNSQTKRGIGTNIRKSAHDTSYCSSTLSNFECCHTDGCNMSHHRSILAACGRQLLRTAHGDCLYLHTPAEPAFGVMKAIVVPTIGSVLPLYTSSPTLSCGVLVPTPCHVMPRATVGTQTESSVVPLATLRVNDARLFGAFGDPIYTNVR